MNVLLNLIFRPPRFSLSTTGPTNTTTTPCNTSEEIFHNFTLKQMFGYWYLQCSV